MHDLDSLSIKQLTKISEDSSGEFLERVLHSLRKKRVKLLGEIELDKVRLRRNSSESGHPFNVELLEKNY